MSIDEIRELIQLVNETGISELAVQRGENRVRIRKSFGPAAAVVPVAATSTPAPAPKTEAPAASKPDSQLVYVKSPIVGTFYEAASPDSPPFASIGDHVTPGKVLCIIESMKLMNEIEADVAGAIESKLVQNGQPVEYGEALFAIRPA